MTVVILQFYLEIDTGGRLSFLDAMLVIDDRRIIFDIYQRHFREGSLIYIQIILFAIKKGTIISLIDKIILLSHPRFQQKKNLIDAIHIFLNNCYPLSFLLYN